MTLPRRIASRPARFVPCGLALAVAALLVGPAAACSVPVFRFALERWPCDAYEAVVVHRGPLSPEQLRLVARLRPVEPATPAKPEPGTNEATAASDAPTKDAPTASDAPSGTVDGANVRLVLIDLDRNEPLADPGLKKIRDEAQGATLPRLVLRHPPKTGSVVPAWTGPLSPEAVDRILDSHARREIARRILAGETAVFVFVGSGNAEVDAPAKKLLEQRLPFLETRLVLPELDPEDIRTGLVSPEAARLRIDFSVVEVRRDDPLEAPFVAMLEGTEEDGTEFALSRFRDKPMAFVLFGRGRALYALVGDGIAHDTIDEACRTLIAPCTCEVKEQNPGSDLLFAVRWDDRLGPRLDHNRNVPFLTGLTGFSPPKDRTPSDATNPPTTRTAPQSANDPASKTAAESVALAPTSSPVRDGPAPTSHGRGREPSAATEVSQAEAGAHDEAESAGSPLLRNLALLAGLVLAGTIAFGTLTGRRAG